MDKKYVTIGLKSSFSVYAFPSPQRIRDKHFFCHSLKPILKGIVLCDTQVTRINATCGYYFLLLLL